MERKLLVVLNIISIFFVLWIQLEIFPFIETDSISFSANGLNIIVLNLSYGLIVSTLFYLVIVYIPENRRKKSTRIVIQDEIDILHDRLIVLFMYFYKINDNKPEDFIKEELSLVTFGKKVVIPNEEMNFEYYRQADNNFKRELVKGRMKTTVLERKWHSASTGNIKLLTFLQNESDYIHDLINNILSYPTISSQDDELIIALFEIRSSKFLRTIENSKQYEYTGHIQFSDDSIFLLYLGFKTLMYYSNQRDFSIIKKE